MSFRIYAAGSDRFRFERDGQSDDDIFTAAEIMSIMQSLEPSRSSFVQAGIDRVLPSSPSGIDAADAIARMVFLRILSDTVTLLATNTRATHGGWISVSASQSNLLFPDSSGFGRYDFSPGDENAGTEFLRSVLPALRESEMNNYGVLRAISMALSEYARHIDEVSSTSTVRLNISVSK